MHINATSKAMSSETSIGSCTLMTLIQLATARRVMFTAAAAVCSRAMSRPVSVSKDTEPLAVVGRAAAGGGGDSMGSSHVAPLAVRRRPASEVTEDATVDPDSRAGRDPPCQTAPTVSRRAVAAAAATAAEVGVLTIGELGASSCVRRVWMTSALAGRLSSLLCCNSRVSRSI